MKMAVIENGVVVNIIEASKSFRPEGMELIRATKRASIGGAWDGKKFYPEPVEAPQANESLERQVMRELAKRIDANAEAMVGAYFGLES